MISTRLILICALAAPGLLIGLFLACGLICVAVDRLRHANQRIDQILADTDTEPGPPFDLAPGCADLHACTRRLTSDDREEGR